ncbi:thymidylate synthase [Acinetobacter phage vB_AbaM_B9]|nr:thymidylate synthase [Acinetobacter phage vB_AbaM_B9]
MSLQREFFNRETNITAKVICDSISESGNRITTLEIEYPRFILCFDEKTEILAKIGDNFPEFMHFDKAKTLGAQVAQYDKDTGEISFVEPLQWVKNQGIHKMINFDDSESKKFSLSVTDNHRVLVDKRTTGNEFVTEVWEAKRLLGDYPCARIRQSGEYKGKTFYSKEEIALMVWFASDGSLNGNKVHFNVKKQRKVDSITGLLNTLNIEYETFCYDDYTLIKCDQFDWVHDCYDSEGFKKLPEKAAYMSNEDYQFVKIALLESDGSVVNNDFNSTSKTFAEQVQVIAHMHNETMNLRYYDTEGRSRLYKSKFKERNSHILLRKDNTKFYESELKGFVYCVTVPSSFVVVRRDGIVHISGNCELNTHKMLEKNSSSSRAIPIKTMIEQIESNTAMPLYWGKTKSGMQADGEVELFEQTVAHSQWTMAYLDAVDRVNEISNVGVHKQTTNRLLEPFQMMKTVITGTDWDNFFNLRIHPDAQPEFCMLAYKMYQAMQESTPKVLRADEWHLPFVDCTRDFDGKIQYVTKVEDEYIELTLEEAQRISASCCAQTSYRKSDDSLEKADKVFDMLINAEVIHSSPFGHLATPIVSVNDHEKEIYKNLTDDFTWEIGITHMKRGGVLCSGNLTGWISYRHLIPNNTCYDFNFEERMKLFDN